MHFTMQAENILQELTRKVVEKEEGLQHQDAEHVEHDSEDECTPSMHLIYSITYIIENC